MTALEVQGLDKSFGGLRVTSRVDLAVEPGERRLTMVSLSPPRLSTPPAPAPEPARRTISRHRRRLGLLYAAPMAVLVTVLSMIFLGWVPGLSER